MKKQKALIIFSDIDETFAPIGFKDLEDFANLVKEIQEKENVTVKFSLISGRQPMYVLAVMNMINSMFEEKGIKEFVEYGAGDQGAVLVNYKEPDNPMFLGNNGDDKLKEYISNLVKSSKIGKYLNETPYNTYINVFKIKNEYQDQLSEKEKNDIYNNLKVSLESKLKDKISISHVVDCLEIAPASIGKDKALQNIMRKYEQQYEIVGITYSGDSENDKKAVAYVSRLSEIPGIKANVLLPANAYEILESSIMEKWKEDKKSVASDNRISKSKYPRFKGVMDLLKEKNATGKLVSKGIQNSVSLDDLVLLKKNKVNISDRDDDIGLEVQKIINDYNIDVKKYLNSGNMSNSVKIIAQEALKDAPSNICANEIKKSNIFVFGDMHAQLDLFIQNLFIAGLINKDALPIPQDKDGYSSCFKKDNIGFKKTIVQLGDTVDSGNQELQGLLYLRALKRVLSKNQIDFQLLSGNHEFKCIKSHPQTLEKAIVREILIQDVLNGTIKASFADNKAGILCFHGGMQKKVLLKTLLQMSQDEKYFSKLGDAKIELENAYAKLIRKKDSNISNIADGDKKIRDELSSESIYKKFVYNRGIKLSDISDFINEKFKTVVKEIKYGNLQIDNTHRYAYLFENADGILYSRKKAYNISNPDRGSRVASDFIADLKDTKYTIKPVQIVGHTTTGKGNTEGFGINGGIKQNRATIFADSGLTKKHGGFQAFVAFDTERFSSYAVEIKDKAKQLGFMGIDDNNNPITLSNKKEMITVRPLHGINL